MTSVRIELPWPSAGLSPNARSRTFHKRVRLTKLARADAVIASRAAKASLPPCDGPLDVLITFHPPGAYRFDRDGLLSRMKPSLDGIAEHLGVDDFRFRPRIEMGAVQKGGNVIVEVTPI